MQTSNQHDLPAQIASAPPIIALFGENYAPRVLRFVAGQLCLLLECEDGNDERVGLLLKAPRLTLRSARALEAAKMQFEV